MVIRLIYARHVNVFMYTEYMLLCQEQRALENYYLLS